MHCIYEIDKTLGQAKASVLIAKTHDQNKKSQKSAPLERVVVVGISLGDLRALTTLTSQIKENFSAHILIV